MVYLHLQSEKISTSVECWEGKMQNTNLLVPVHLYLLHGWI
jgi:hypothetical protein